jgi:hypothetical protein
MTWASQIIEQFTSVPPGFLHRELRMHRHRNTPGHTEANSSIFHHPSQGDTRADCVPGEVAVPSGQRQQLSLRCGQTADWLLTDVIDEKSIPTRSIRSLVGGVRPGSYGSVMPL